jgi:surfeit locus 1 family protein
MRFRTIALVATSILFAAVCTSLGFWQLRRLHEKQQYNTRVAARRFMQPIPFDSIPQDTTLSKFRRVRLEGRYDYSREIVWTLRGREGSPGVNILTPLMRAGTDTAVLINRGWVYSPDATKADLTLWHEGETLDGDGYVLPLHAPKDVPGASENTRAFRTLDLVSIRKAFPYPISPVFVVLATPPVNASTTPPRVTLIPLDEGSHRSYAFQWFSFAAISIIGAYIFIRKT